MLMYHVGVGELRYGPLAAKAKRLVTHGQAAKGWYGSDHVQGSTMNEEGEEESNKKMNGFGYMC